jgi:hypothetical protein
MSTRELGLDYSQIASYDLSMNVLLNWNSKLRTQAKILLIELHHYFCYG